MGLLEQINAGAKFSRKTISLPSFSTGVISGSLQTPGGAYILLNVTATKAVRLRLYNDSASVNADTPRSQTSFELDDSIGLIADIGLDSGSTFTLNPPILANTFANGQTWYHASASLGNASIQFEVYPIGVVGDSIVDRSVIEIKESAIPTTGYGASGSLNTRRSFLLLSGSADVKSRLRLYSTNIFSVPAAEQTRSFGVRPAANSKLIADFMFDTASYSYKFTPLLEGYTWPSQVGLVTGSNINPDPQWAQGNSNDGDGWQGMEERQLTSLLPTVSTNKVSHIFPSASSEGSTQYAMKMATREGVYWASSNFYFQPINAGSVYRISGYAYASGSTYRGILNGGNGSADYPIGYVINLYDSGYSLTRRIELVSPIGTVGWRYFSNDVFMRSNEVYMQAYPYVDGPWPYVLDGLGNPIYGPPSCSVADAAAGCPGFAWFTGFETRELTLAPVTDLNEYMIGTGVVGYQLQNMSAGTANVTASLYIYSLED